MFPKKKCWIRIRVQQKIWIRVRIQYLYSASKGNKLVTGTSIVEG